MCGLASQVCYGRVGIDMGVFKQMELDLEDEEIEQEEEIEEEEEYEDEGEHPGEIELRRGVGRYHW